MSPNYDFISDTKFLRNHNEAQSKQAYKPLPPQKAGPPQGFKKAPQSPQGPPKSRRPPQAYRKRPLFSPPPRNEADKRQRLQPYPKKVQVKHNTDLDEISAPPKLGPPPVPNVAKKTKDVPKKKRRLLPRPHPPRNRVQKESVNESESELQQLRHSKRPTISPPQPAVAGLRTTLPKSKPTTSATPTTTTTRPTAYPVTKRIPNLPVQEAQGKEHFSNICNFVRCVRKNYD